MREFIGKELKELRLKHNLSLDELAKKLGINKSTMLKYENGTLDITIEKLDIILDYYNIQKDTFYDRLCAEVHTDCKGAC